MRTSIIILAFLIATAASTYVFDEHNLLDVDPKDVLQQIFDGLWEQANLTDPTTVVDCFVGDSPQQTVDFFGNLTDTLAKELYLKAPAIVLDYKKNLDPTVITCMQNNSEVLEVSTAYGTANITLPTLFGKIEKYTIAHADEMHTNFQKLDDDFQGGDYKTYGADSGAFLQAIMNNSY